ncbi:arylamine N-acetyltransferase family protein [Vibrio tapetis]|uniref:N-acetyltransferase family protein n=1 Tax=Vibrio tapetis subsp. tapetis TaxID=1671868 RepID=A0A2N8ZD70_9VIBR|nr:arylamine N-acetyltransferase [Vibrio tapetis]SON49825.1 N-acetyltransferase family protein [Vibrio tapetis subsp. tapetis]
MNIPTFNSEEYLRRINLKGDVTPSLNWLRVIHRAQHRTIPFENLDIALGRGIDLSLEAIFNKTVRSKRGGYCFEVNKLLLSALTYYGFECRELLARVHVTGKATGRSHFISLVTINDQQWIVDAGFGSNTPSEPVPFILNNELTTSSSQTLRLVEDETFGFMLQMKTDDDWSNLYSFDLTHVCEGDITYGNFFTSSSPSSVFFFARVAVIPIENGMVTLFNHTLKQTVNGEETIIELGTGQNYLHALKTYFNIEIDASYDDFKPIEHT